MKIKLENCYHGTKTNVLTGVTISAVRKTLRTDYDNRCQTYAYLEVAWQGYQLEVAGPMVPYF